MEEILKNLTPEQCIEIASIAEPTKKWKLIQSKHIWDGFDLIEDADGIDETNSKYVFQIDFRDELELDGKERFRLYKNLEEYPITQYRLFRIYINSFSNIDLKDLLIEIYEIGNAHKPRDRKQSNLMKILFSYHYTYDNWSDKFYEIKRSIEMEIIDRFRFGIIK